MDAADKPSDSTMSHQLESNIGSDSTKNDVHDHTEKKSIVSNKNEKASAYTTTSVNGLSDTTESTEQSEVANHTSECIISENAVLTTQYQNTVNEHQNDSTELAVTTNVNTETTTANTEITTHSDSAMYDGNDNEISTYIPKTDPVVIAGDGNVSLIGTLQEEMGKEPLRVSKEESQMLIGMLNEIQLQPVDSPDPASIPIGGGYIMTIESGERYILLGGRYLQIGDKYYYDANNKSDALSSKIGSVLYGYYGEP